MMYQGGQGAGRCHDPYRPWWKKLCHDTGWCSSVAASGRVAGSERPVVNRGRLPGSVPGRPGALGRDGPPAPVRLSQGEERDRWTGTRHPVKADGKRFMVGQFAQSGNGPSGTFGTTPSPDVSLRALRVLVCCFLW